MAPKRVQKRKSQRGRGPAELLGKLNQLAKDTQIISKGLAMSSNPYLQSAGEVASQFGYGRQHGGSLFDGLGNLAMGIGTGAGNLAMGLGGGLHQLFGGRRRQRGGSWVGLHATSAAMPMIR